MAERRAGERRLPTAEADSDRRERDRRFGDRRDSPRIPLKILVRQVQQGGSFEEHDGDIAVGGIYFTERHPPVGSVVELRFRIPTAPKEIRCRGRILKVSAHSRGYGAHVIFEELPVTTELAIARFIDEQD